jgi:hypothetical protein
MCRGQEGQWGRIGRGGLGAGYDSGERQQDGCTMPPGSGRWAWSLCRKVDPGALRHSMLHGSQIKM